MKIMSTTALALTLALGAVGAAGVVGSPALAQKKKKEEAKAPSFNLSKPVREAYVAGETALKAGDTATATAKVAEVKAAAKTDDDRYLGASLLFEVSKVTKDPKQQAEALDGMLAGPRLTGTQREQVLLVVGQNAAQAGNYARSEEVLREAIRLNANNTDAVALLAETLVKAGKPAESIALFQQAMATSKQNGQKLPANWYARAVNISYTAKLPQQTEALTQDWLVAYPTKDAWRDSLVMWRDLNKADAETQIDLMRLQRTANALKGAGDYSEYAYSVYAKNPGEAKAVIDEGVRAGFLNLASNQNMKEINGVVTQRMTADKASLGKSAADAKGAKGTAKLALNVADGYLGYEMWPQAAELYKLALAKGGVDANLVNTRLGMALLRSGDKAGAAEAFGKVTGPRASLVKYWTILMAQGPAAA